ncbi:MAG: pyruvate ferredoxin oxidoreductase, partial [Dehalococcoidia bacterium]|nr:pyruvate ferredoxin oxidoreductase [Dehalococcoidia bacterium]
MQGEFIKFGKNLVSKDELLTPGHRACQGCGLGLTIRLALKVLGKDTVVGIPAGCWAGVGSMYPDTAWRIPWMQTLFENSAAQMSGIESAYRILMDKGKMPERKINCVAIAGDGATNDIGVAALSGVLERGHDILYICLDNEAYMNTGIQRSSATPYGASTTTTPAGRVSVGQVTWKKNMIEIVAAHNIPYVTSACPSYPFDLMDKVRKGADTKGPAYIHVLAPCPTGWRFPTESTIEIGRLAVETGVFPIYEVENGRYKLNIDRPSLKPVEEYLKPQGRFRHLADADIEMIQKRVSEEYDKLK